MHARSLGEDMTVNARPALSMVAAAAALVLLIACANVASLLLSRGVARQREFAIRAALGGTRARLARQLLTESALIAVAGSAIGLLLAVVLMRSLRIAAPTSLPRVDDVAFDLPVVIIWIVTMVLAAASTGVGAGHPGDTRRSD